MTADRQMLPEGMLDQIGAIRLCSVGNPQLLLLGSDKFISSPLLRKIGVLTENGTELEVDVDPDGKILQALTLASRTFMLDPHDVVNWLDAWDYLLIPPPLELLCSVTQRTLLTRATTLCDELSVVPLRSRFREIGNRGFLDVAIGELPGGAAPDAPQGDLGRQLGDHSGYLLSVAPSPLEDANPQQLEEEVQNEKQLAPHLEQIVQAIKAIGLLVYGNHLPDSSAKDPFFEATTKLIGQTVKQVVRTVSGAKLCILEGCLCLNGGESISKAMTVLYSAECRGRPDCILDLETVAAYRDTVPSKFKSVAKYLPIHDVKDHPCLVMPIQNTLPKRTAPRVTADVLRDLECRAPWVPGVLQPGRLWITGSLLSETLEGPETPESASDVDLFCNKEDLDHFCEIVEQAMLRYGTTFGAASVNKVRVSDAKWRLELPCESPATPHAAACKCDLYINSVERVRRYHLPFVRAAFDGETVSIYPSCAVALGTRVNMDYDYIAGAKSPFSIVYKMWRRSFTLCVTKREQRQMRDYAIHALTYEVWKDVVNGAIDYVLPNESSRGTSAS